MGAFPPGNARNNGPRGRREPPLLALLPPATLLHFSRNDMVWSWRHLLPWKATKLRKVPAARDEENLYTVVVTRSPQVNRRVNTDLAQGFAFTITRLGGWPLLPAP